VTRVADCPVEPAEREAGRRLRDDLGSMGANGSAVAMVSARTCARPLRCLIWAAWSLASLVPACGGRSAPEQSSLTTTTQRSVSSVTTMTATTPITTHPVTSEPAAADTTIAPMPVAAAPYRFPIGPTGSVSYGHAHHDYPATDIFAPCGSEVVAPVDGVVQEIGRVDLWDPRTNDGATRGGLFTSIVGDDGVRYYGSHLSAVAPAIAAGARIRAGQRLGSVGNTGDARGVGCHLHFGLSPPCGPGDWAVRRGTVYPWPFLDSWRAGGQSSPVAAVAAWNAVHHPC